MNDKITILFDASALALAGCVRRLRWTVVDGYRSKVNPNDMEFGTAIHKFRAIYRQKGREGLSEGVHTAMQHMRETPMFVKPNKKFLTPEFAAAVCLEYHNHYPPTIKFETLRPDGEKALVEQRFIFPYFIWKNYEVALVGTIDEIGRFKSGLPAICDMKTTSMWDVEDYLRAYYLSHQLMFYNYILRKLAEAHPDDFVSEIYKYELGHFIDAVFLPNSGDISKVRFLWSDVFIFKEETILEFEKLLQRTLYRFLEDLDNSLQTDTLPPREGIVTGACRGKFQECAFFNACISPDSRTATLIVQQNFAKVEYNPLLFQT